MFKSIMIYISKKIKEFFSGFKRIKITTLKYRDPKLLYSEINNNVDDVVKEVILCLGEIKDSLAGIEKKIDKKTGEVKCWYCYKKYGLGHKCGACGREGK